MENLQEHLNKDFREDISKLYDHAKIANEEVGAIKEHIAVLETNTKWIKEILEKVDMRTWVILGTIIFGVLIQILFKIMS